MSVRGRFQRRATRLAKSVAVAARSRRPAPPILVRDEKGETSVDTYWNRHTVNAETWMFAGQSKRYLKERSARYPLFAELMDLYADRSGEVVLDYGCGPGHDVIGFLLWSNARKVIGMDVSLKALHLVQDRVALHRVPLERVELIRITDSRGAVPLPDASVDWLHSGGVLHHTTHPHEIVREFARVMRPGAQGRLMLYNRASVWYHVWIAYAQRIVNDAYPGLDVDQAFTKSTDGPDCPVSDAWAPERVVKMAEDAGLHAEFRGGYFNVTEFDWWKQYGKATASDERLGEEHRRFASEVVVDERGYPTWRGKTAGIGGVYAISKPR